MQEKNYKLAKDFLGASCELNLAEACFANAQYYMKAKNYQESLKNYFKACVNLNHAKACNQLGVIYIQSAKKALAKDIDYIKQNTSIGLNFLKKSCDLNDVFACVNLYQLYKQNNSGNLKNIKMDKNLANGFLEKSCKIYLLDKEKIQNIGDFDFEKNCSKYKGQ